MAWLKTFINGFFATLRNAFIWVLDNIVSILTDILYWIWDGLLTVLHEIISQLSFCFGGFSTVLHWAKVPPQAIYVVNQIGIREAVAIIFCAMVIRLGLNLIPGMFTRV